LASSANWCIVLYCLLIYVAQVENSSLFRRVIVLISFRTISNRRIRYCREHSHCRTLSESPDRVCDESRRYIKRFNVRSFPAGLFRSGTIECLFSCFSKITLIESWHFVAGRWTNIRIDTSNFYGTPCICNAATISFKITFWGIKGSARCCGAGRRYVIAYGFAKLNFIRCTYF
jgi:hypothetical protein